MTYKELGYDSFAERRSVYDLPPLDTPMLGSLQGGDIIPSLALGDGDSFSGGNISPTITPGNAGEILGDKAISFDKLDLIIGQGVNTVGMSGTGAESTSIRIWAGETFGNRGSAPFRVTAAGAVVASSISIIGGDVGGWVITPTTLYGLSSGTPTVAPNDGIVMTSGATANIRIYEDTEERIRLGNLAAGIYGLRGYATDGTTTLFELSDTQNFIAGWTISSTTLANSTNIILDAFNRAISINSATWQAQGVQLQYNAGTPRVYIGDGGVTATDYYIMFDGTNIAWNAVATSLSTAGLLTTTSALIGGWNVVDGYIYNLQSGTPTVAPNDGIVLASGNEGIIVYEDTAERVRVGYLSAGIYGLRGFATDGTTTIFELSDTLQQIAGWNFTNTVLRTGATDAASNVLIDSANSLMRLGPTTGNSISMDGANQRVRSSNYVAGVSGFTVEPLLIEAQNIVARGTMSGTVFRYDVINATGGRQIVANADALASAMTALDASTLTTRGNVTLAVNDILIIRAQTALGIQEEYLRVTGVGAAPIYTVTRDLAGTFAADTNPVWPAGTPVVQLGVSDGAAAFSGGWLDLVGEASSGADWPRFSVIQRTGVAYNAFTERVRMGNLNGYLGYVADIYGIGIGSSVAGEANITIEPTNGLRIRSGTTTLMQVDMVGTATIGSFTLAATTISATNLTLTSGAANTANITVGTGATAGGLNSANAGGDIIFWGGDTFANRATAPYRVTAGGALAATTGTILGSFNILTGGNIRSGQTAYDTGTGYFVEYNAGTPRLSLGVGGSTTANLTWNGTTLTVNGSTISAQPFFGNGSDGDVTISGNTTLTRDMYYSNLTINAGFTLNPGGYRIFVSGTCTINATGIIGVGGGNGGNGGDGDYGVPGLGGSSGTGGAAAHGAGSLSAAVAGVTGGAGGNGNAIGNAGADGGNVTNSLGVAGVYGGNGGSDAPVWGGSGGVGGGTIGTVTNSEPRNVFEAISMRDAESATLARYNGSGGCSGGGGGAGGNGGTPNGGGGGGAGSGANGGLIFLTARTLVNNGSINATGGNGGDGGDGGGGANPRSGSGGGGGAAGHGGFIILIYTSTSGSGTTSVAAGSAGTFGIRAPGGSGNDGTAGQAGTAGTVFTLTV